LALKQFYIKNVGRAKIFGCWTSKMKTNFKKSEQVPMIGNKNICLFVYMQIISHDLKIGRPVTIQNKPKS
jgi:hypothetical protein